MTDIIDKVNNLSAMMQTTFETDFADFMIEVRERLENLSPEFFKDIFKDVMNEFTIQF